MIKLKSLLKEEMTYLGGMKVPVQLVDMFYTLEMCPKGNIYVYPQNQTRLFKGLEKFGEKAIVEPLLNQINNKYGEKGYYRFNQTEVDPTKPLMFLYVPNA